MGDVVQSSTFDPSSPSSEGHTSEFAGQLVLTGAEISRESARVSISGGKRANAWTFTLMCNVLRACDESVWKNGAYVLGVLRT